MFELTFNTFFLLYLLLTILALLALWVKEHFRQRKKKISSPEKKLHACEFCHFVYLSGAEEALNRCPQCLLLNKKKL